MRVLFTGPGSAGHLFPMVPTAQALRAAGHEVLFGVPAPVEMLRGSGLPLVDIGDGSTIFDAFRRAAVSTDTYRSDGSDRQADVRRAASGFAEHSRSALPGLRELTAAWRPDLIVHAAFQGAAPLVAAEQGTPAVVHNFGVASRHWIADALAGQLAEEYRAAGLAPDPEAAATTVLDVVPASLGGDGDGLRVRYTPFNGGGTVPRELFRQVGGEGRDRRRVAVTLGTVLTEVDGVRAIRRLVDQAAAVDAEFLLAVGGSDLSPLGELPPNVRPLPWVPLAELVSVSDAIVHHGGSGTMLTAAAVGVPQLILPQGADHFFNADAATRAGFALRSADEEVDRALLDRLLSDEPLREAAAGTRAEIAALPSPADLVPELERVAEPVQSAVSAG